MVGRTRRMGTIGGEASGCIDSSIILERSSKGRAVSGPGCKCVATGMGMSMGIRHNMRACIRRFWGVWHKMQSISLSSLRSVGCLH